MTKIKYEYNIKVRKTRAHGLILEVSLRTQERRGIIIRRTVEKNVIQAAHSDSV